VEEESHNIYLKREVNLNKLNKSKLEFLYRNFKEKDLKFSICMEDNK